MVSSTQRLLTLSFPVYYVSNLNFLARKLSRRSILPGKQVIVRPILRVQLVKVVVSLCLRLFLVKFDVLEEYSLLFFVVFALAARGVLLLGVGGWVLLCNMLTFVVAALTL